MLIRPEASRDFAAIREVNRAAFLQHPFSGQTEPLIIEALRTSGALEISLVADVHGEVVGHIAFSRATIGDASAEWYLLGPVAVLPDHQGRRVGRALIEVGIAELRVRDAAGCVLVGDPLFYRRFGFSDHPGLTGSGVPDENVLCLPLASEPPVGEIVYHPAFTITA